MSADVDLCKADVSADSDAVMDDVSDNVSLTQPC